MHYLFQVYEQLCPVKICPVKDSTIFLGGPIRLGDNVLAVEVFACNV